jgi:hypothetical protein
VFSFKTPIQDLDYDSRGRMFFSAVGGGRGVIYHLNRHRREHRKYIELPVETVAQKSADFGTAILLSVPTINR